MYLIIFIYSFNQISCCSFEFLDKSNINSVVNQKFYQLKLILEYALLNNITSSI